MFVLSPLIYLSSVSFEDNYYIEKNRCVSFDFKFSRQGVENVCLHRKVCGAIQHALSKRSLVDNWRYVCLDSLRPNNNLSVKQGRAFLGLTSTNIG